MRPKARVWIVGLLIGLAVSGVLGIVQGRFGGSNTDAMSIAATIEYQFVGDDSPTLETLTGNPSWSTDRIVELFEGGQWQFLNSEQAENGQFVFQPGPRASVRPDLFPISGIYSTTDEELLFRGEQRSIGSSAIATIDGILSLAGDRPSVELIYTVVALDSQRVMRVSQTLSLAEDRSPITAEATIDRNDEPLFNGTWELPGFGPLILQQRGQQVEGTYSMRGGGELVGQVEGSWLRFTWRDRTETGEGFLRAVSQGRTLSGLLETETGNLNSLLATRTSEPTVDEAELAGLNRQQLRDESYDLVLDSQCDRAIPYLNRALPLYRADRDDPEIWEVMKDSSLIDEINISTRLIHCHFQLKNYEPLLDALISAIETRRILSDRPYLSELAQQGLDNLSERLEQWRSRLAEDTERIAAVDGGQRFFNTLVRVFVELEGYNNALVASEQSRARAFADLLYRQLSVEQASEFVTARPLTVEDIRRVAQEQNATLVEYFWAKEAEQLYSWIVSPAGEIQFQTTAAPSELSSWVQRTQDSFERRRGFVLTENRDIGRAEEDSLLDELYELLIKPVEASLPSDETARVIFVPQGELFLVPFPALQAESGKYLIEQHTVQTAPSIQAIDLIHRRYVDTNQTREWQADDFLLVGNPQMPTVTLNNASTPTPLPALSGAQQEVEKIGEMVGAAWLTGAAASERRVTEQMATARVIHLATHGLLEYAESGQTPGVLALAPGDGLDGLLTSNDILQLKLKADLVVLSACDTGRGRITGDGVIGLSRSLLQAGAASVVVSLWAVPDEATAALMEAFYAELQKGEDKAKALKQAMQITRETYLEPENWAAFTLIGEVS